MAVPYILPESSVNTFKFYNKGAIHDAVLTDGKILRLAGIFSATQKQEAFDFARILSQTYFTVMTPSSASYRVWVDVCCADDFNLGQPLHSTAPSPATNAGVKPTHPTVVPVLPHLETSVEFPPTQSPPLAKSSPSEYSAARVR